MVSDRGRKLVRTLLILAANPKGTERLRLDEEVKKIEQGLERSKRRDQFKLVVKWAVTDDDLRRAMLDNEPEIVHFSGHGVGSGHGDSGRDFVTEREDGTGGLAFENDSGQVQLITGDALARLFELCADSVKCVVLNACYSEVQAKAISQHIGYVVGMKKAIGDEAAIKFAVGFYDALGAGRNFETAYKFGCSAIDLNGIPEYLTPVLKKKSISVTAPTQPSSASPPDASSAGLPGP
jgi:CHAT domain